MRAVASLYFLRSTKMRAMECLMCRRPAAWLIDTEVFCEGHKELIIEAAGVDRFRIRRLTEAGRVRPAIHTNSDFPLPLPLTFPTPNQPQIPDP